MFSDERLTTIFSNIEEIYQFSRSLLFDLERQFNRESPQSTEMGCVFLKYVRSSGNVRVVVPLATGFSQSCNWEQNISRKHKKLNLIRC